jgi:NSS family neurotransmitter:Na+ symporter
MFYYSVVAGWCLRYFLMAATGPLLRMENHLADWNDFTSTWQPAGFHFLSISLGIFVISRGVVHGIERANRLLIPSLFVLIVISAARAVSLPGALAGLNALFAPDLHQLLNYKIWLHALTQNAWDTGAGWGLIMTYAIYMRKREDIPLNALLIGLGNNSVSLLAAITVFCTAFAMAPDSAQQIIGSSGPANTGLTFIWIPQLFQQMQGGRLFLSFFFLALTFAALSSLISMLELTTRILMDMGATRPKALRIVYSVGFVLGLPSALSIDFFLNQDWVWGLGLIVSGAFIAVAVAGYGPSRLRQEIINVSSDFWVGQWYDRLIRFGIPLQVLILISWWFWQVIKASPQTWWNPLSPESVGTCVLQWGGAALILMMLNRVITPRVLK